MAKRLDDLMLDHIRDAGLPEPVREHVFHQSRKWAFDFAWPGYRIAVEVEGGVWTGGRHTRGRGFTADCGKYNAAAVMGWMVLRFTGDMIRGGEAIETLKAAIREVQAA